MSTIKVRLKDASGNVLHPETDWSVVQNKPSIEVDGHVQTWNNPSDGSADQTVKIKTFSFIADAFSIDLSAFGISVSDYVTNNTKVPLADYPINYEKLANKPTYFPTSWSKISGKPTSNCGLYFYTNTNTSPVTYTLLIDSMNDSGTHYTYYFSSGNWAIAPTDWKSKADLIF